MIKRQIKIKSKFRFIFFVLVLLTIITILCWPRTSCSNTEYQPYRVAFGDTYWNIAKELQKAGYKPNADIREIVHELVQQSGTKAHQLREGDIIYVPKIRKEDN